MPVTCATCGQANRSGARFCDNCGAALGTAADATVARKVVTIVFADLVGSTALHERLDAESARAVMDRYYQALHRVVAAHGGTVVKLLGDGVMAAFGVPRVAEDDALRAVRAAAAMVDAVRALGAPAADAATEGLAVRVAVNSGEVVVSADQRDVVGDPVNVAARLQQQAGDGQVLLGDATRRLVGDQVTLAPVGALALRGRAEAVAAYRLVSLARPVGAAAAPFVGRDEELRHLAALHDDAVRARHARLAVVLGSPGLGKSRLLSEIQQRLAAHATVLAARCDAAGGATFDPLVEALRAHLDVARHADAEALRAAVAAALPGDDPERARIAAGVAALLAGTAAAPEETFFVVRRLLGALAAARPVVLIVDDAQWAAPLLLDLVEHLAQWTTDAPLLLLLAARPELRELRPALSRGDGARRQVLTLAGLDAGAATRLAASVIGADELPAAIAGRVLATSEGNPLFVGELVRMLVQDGALRRDGDRWTAAVEPAALAMPPTIHALLAARIERLRPEERAVLERAAVVGRSFSRAAVAALLPAEAAASLDTHLQALRRGELIEPDPAPFLGEPALRFHHVLIRDAAYRQVLKGTRAALHVRFADWIAGGGGEHEETIGWHLEQAHGHLAELGPLDASGRAIGARAAQALAAAGRRALARDDLPLAAALLGRASARLEDGDAARAGIALDWCEALLAAGDVGPAAAALAELERFADAAPRLRAWHTCLTGRLAVLAAPRALRSTADAVTRRRRGAGRHAGDALARRRRTRCGPTHSAPGRHRRQRAAPVRALAAARRAGDRRRASAVLAGVPLAALWGPSPVTRASGRCLDVVRVLRITQGAPAVEAVALRCQAVLEALRSRADAARRLIASSRRLVEELGITHRLLEADLFAGMIALLEGDAVAAERRLRPAYEGLRAQGLGIDAARAAAYLASALLAQARLDEAEALSHACETLAGDDLQAAIAWRGVRAEVLARRGQPEAAVALARAAVEIAATTDALLDHADARRALATALRAAGRDADAAAETARAVALWQAKGAVVLIARERAEPSADDRVAARPRPSEAWRAPAALPPAPPAETPPAGPMRFENAALRTAERMRVAALARDARAFAALLAPHFRSADRTPAVQLELDRDEWLTSGRAMLQGGSILAIDHEVLATRGERLSLLRVRWVAGGGTVGPGQLDWLQVLEVAADGRAVAEVAFDPGDVDAAYAELDRRYAAGESAPFAAVTAAMEIFRHALAARDWEALADVLAPDLVVHDHRPLGWEATRGPQPYVDALRELVALAPDVRLRLDHADVCAHGYLALSTWVGTHEGGIFEAPSYIVGELDASRRARRFDQYDLAQLAAAQARWAALRQRPAPLDNAAFRLRTHIRGLFAAGDWPALRALAAPDFRYDDRRRWTQLAGGVDFWIRSMRTVREADVLPTFELLVAVGDRVSVERALWRGQSEGGGVEIEYVSLTQLDVEGRLLRSLNFDPEDRDAAVAAARALAGAA
ncbi:AAA family ATPase [bacterium]|nr:AAA family ATPase [bacterium]